MRPSQPSSLTASSEASVPPPRLVSISLLTLTAPILVRQSDAATGVLPRYVTGLRGAPTAKMVVVDLELDVGLQEPAPDANKRSGSSASSGYGGGRSGGSRGSRMSR